MSGMALMNLNLIENPKIMVAVETSLAAAAFGVPKIMSISHKLEQ